MFSYIAPSNVVGWILSPLRYFMPFRQYVKMNRTVIKVTHIPVLFFIFGYERVVLSKFTYTETDLIEKPARSERKPLAFGINKAQGVYSPGRRLLREPSVVSFRKDRALEEVFRRPFRGSTVRTTPRDMEIDRGGSTNVVANWMQLAENEGGASPPLEQPRSVVERLENRRPTLRRSATADRANIGRRSRDFSLATRSMVSDPDPMSTIASRRPYKIDEEAEELPLSSDILRQETEADGDVENNGESELAGPAIGESAVSVIDKENRRPYSESEEEQFFQTPTTGKSPMMQLSSPAAARLQRSADFVQGGSAAYQIKPRTMPSGHNRKISSGTTLFVPVQLQGEDSSSPNPPRPSRPLTAKNTNTGGTATPVPINLLSGQRTPKLKPAKARPIMPPRQKTAPNPLSGIGMSFLDVTQGSARQPSFYARALDLASEIGDNKWGPTSGIDVGGISGMPASFSEQLLREREVDRKREEERRRDEDEEKGMVNRIMLARMNTLEEGFREVLREIKDLTRSTANSSRRDSDADVGQSLKELKQNLHEAKARKSPKKATRREAKGKEIQGLTALTKAYETKTPSPASGRSIGERAMEGNADVSGGFERPGTAVRTPEPRRQSD